MGSKGEVRMRNKKLNKEFRPSQMRQTHILEYGIEIQIKMLLDGYKSRGYMQRWVRSSTHWDGEFPQPARVRSERSEVRTERRTMGAMAPIRDKKSN